MTEKLSSPGEIIPPNPEVRVVASQMQTDETMLSHSHVEGDSVSISTAVDPVTEGLTPLERSKRALVLHGMTEATKEVREKL